MDQSESTENNPAAQFSREIPSTLYTKLPELACYEVSGEDAKSFLQSQFTNDINEVSASQGQLNSYCTPKGRMLAIFYIFQWQEHYYLVIPQDIASSVIKRIQMYIMRAKVTITDRSDELAIHALFGQNSEQALNNLGYPAPTSVYETVSNERVCSVQVEGIVPRYILIGGDEISQSLNEAASKGDIKMSTEDYWQWLDIMTGIPVIHSETQEAFVPQMTNLELINGVSFSKGCYPGQEVVARLHYLGNANRRMYRISSSDKIMLNPGDDIYASDAEKNQAIGKVISAVISDTKEVAGLAVLRVEAANNNKLSIGSATGPAVEVMSLPYAIPPAEKK